jgi:hypothetical protein
MTPRTFHPLKVGLVRSALLACAALAVTSGVAMGQVDQKIQIDPNIITQRSDLEPSFKIDLKSLPDLAIVGLDSVNERPDANGDLDLIIDVQNRGSAPFSLKFSDAEGRVQPTFELIYMAPEQSLGDLFNPDSPETEPPVVKRVFLDTVLGSGQTLTTSDAIHGETQSSVRVSLPKLPNGETRAIGVHRIVVMLDPAETLIERSRRNNMAAFTWTEEIEAVVITDPQILLPLKVPTEKPVPVRRPFE